MKVVVEEYNTRWAQDYLQLEQELCQYLHSASYKSIEHVGSTAVPGLAAKPVIDIDIIVERDHLTNVVRALEAGGYKHLGEYGITDRHAFRKPEAPIQHNLYACIDGCVSLRNHLALRDLCRSNETIRDAYSKTKLDLAEREWANIDEYCMAKNEIIEWILNQSEFSRGEMDLIRSENSQPLKV